MATFSPAGVDRPDNAAGTLGIVRRVLFGTLVLGMAGTATELLLLGHFEEPGQIVPLVLLALGLVVAVWHSVAPRRATVRTLQALMILFVLSGGLGVMMHYHGNEEFELEMYPSMRGIELARKTLTGATPVLAPGTMVVLGLLGLAHAYRHPRLDAGNGSSKEE